MGKPDEPWISSIRANKELVIRSEAESGVWTGVLQECVPIFNRIALKAMSYRLAGAGEKANVVLKIAGSHKDDPKVAGGKHGITRRHKQQAGRGGIGVIEVEIFLPSQPTADSKNMITMIILHELGHAAGLEEHTSDGVMMTVPNENAKGQVFSTPQTKKMPPFFFTNKTVNRLRTIWKA